MIPAYKAGLETLRILHNKDDYERYLDIYDVSLESIQEALSDEMNVSGADTESLGFLRLLAYRHSILRRSLLCSLLSLEADGGSPDFARWRAATDIMESLSHLAGVHAKGLSDALRELQGKRL